MKNSVRTVRPDRRANASANTSQRSDEHPKYSKIRHSLPKTAPKSAAIVQRDSKPRITRPAQLQIIRLYLHGSSLSEIAEQTGYARQTVTRVCRSEDVQAVLRETKAIILGESDAWAESLHYAVTHETDGKLSYRLLKDFGVIPSAVEPEPEK
jgi:hypothetical protein